MDFKDKQAIFLQIAEYICEQILFKKFQVGEKIPSIRDLAVQLEVNPNTVQRTYDFLQQKEIISNKRGIGYFVENQAEEKILVLRREQFIENDLPVFFKNLYFLNISLSELQAKYEDFVKQINNNEHEN